MLFSLFIHIYIKFAFLSQEAMESAEVNKMDLLRTVDGTVIYEDSNSQPQNQVKIQLYSGSKSKPI